MMRKETYLTPEGLKSLQEELDHLHRVRRSEVAARIHKANETGGTVDNAEYDEAKNEQAFVEGTHPRAREPAVERGRRAGRREGREGRQIRIFGDGGG